MKTLKYRRPKVIRSRSESIAMWCVFAIFFVYSITLVFPFVWMFINSFKEPAEFFRGNIWGLPESWRFENYSEIFAGLPTKDGSGIVIDTRISGKLFGVAHKYSIFEMMILSVIMTVSCTLSNIFFAATSSYVVAKYRFKGRRFIYDFAIFLMIVPIAGTLPQQYRLLSFLGLNNAIGVFLMSSAGFGMNFFLLYGFFKNISATYAEAARIDGAGHFMVFFKIMIPLAAPVIVSLSVIYAIGIWNDYTTPSIYMKETPTLAYGLFVVRNLLEGKGAYTQSFAAMMIALIPILAVFIAFSNTIMENTIAGGIKG